MLVTSNAPESARWEVMWVSNNRIIRKSFGDDLPEALRIYAKACAARKRAVTLRCKNIGFAPAGELRPYTKRMRRKGTRKIVTVQVTPMHEHNLAGVFWCPYCMQLRKFVFKRYIMSGNQELENPSYYCPMCNINTSNWHVQRHNPIAFKIEARFSQRRRGPRRS